MLLGPLTLATGAETAYLASLLLRLALAAAGVVWWLRQHGVADRVAVTAGLLVATGPYARGVLHSGVPEALSVLTVPWFAGLLAQGLGSAERAPRLGRLAGAAAFGIWLVLDGMYGAAAGALAGAAVLFSGPMTAGRAGRGVIVAAAVGLAAWAQQRGLDALGHGAFAAAFVPKSFDAGWHTAGLGGADLLNFVLPTWAMPESGAGVRHRHVAYLGIPLLLAAGLAAKHPVGRGLVALGLVTAGFALGSRLGVGGEKLLPLPGAVLTASGGVHVYRLAGLAGAALVGAVAVGLAGRVRMVALVLVALDQSLAFPLTIPSTPTPTTVVDAWLAEGEGAVLDLPLDREGGGNPGPWPQRTFFDQTRHGRPIASGFHQVRSSVWELRVVRHTQAAVGAGWSMAAAGQIPPSPPSLRAVTWDRERDELLAQGFTALSLDLSAVRDVQRAELRAWFVGGLGEPTIDDGARVVWSLE